MSLLTRWRRSAAEKHVQQRLLGQAETIADIASVSQAALAEIAALHAYTTQKVAYALVIASSLGVDMDDRDDRRRFWLTYFIDHTTRVVDEAEGEMSKTIKFYGDVVRWKSL